jgi:hypothetical protein
MSSPFTTYNVPQSTSPLENMLGSDTLPSSPVPALQPGAPPPEPRPGGPIRKFLTSYLGNVASNLTGQPTEYEQQQTKLKNFLAVQEQARRERDTNSEVNLRTAQAGQYQPYPLDPATANLVGLPPGTVVSAKDVPALLRLAFTAQQKQDTPETQAFNQYLKQGMNPADAFKAVQQTKQDVKPDTGAADDQRYEQILMNKLQKQPVAPEDNAFVQAYEKRKTLGPVASAAVQQPNKDLARSDNSYKLNSGILDRYSAPIDSSIQRFGRLQDTINQNSPQADALVAPELLTVMAGGQGSGLRMNEAEISRIVGGRSKWEDLQAAANKWSLNPQTANSITPDQRQQIRALMGAVNQKLTDKQNILDQARQDLINSNDPLEHRRIVAAAHQRLSAIDQGIAVPQNVTPNPRQPAAIPGGNEASSDFERRLGIRRR